MSGGSATPLHFAASNGKVEAMKLLIDLGAEINPRNKERKTPLFCAAGNGEIEAVKILKEYGGVMK
jgi:ankyrin repeat protein